MTFRVAVRGVDLHAVEPGLAHQHRHLGEAAAQSTDLGLGQWLRLPELPARQPERDRRRRLGLRIRRFLRLASSLRDLHPNLPAASEGRVGPGAETRTFGRPMARSAIKLSGRSRWRPSTITLPVICNPTPPSALARYRRTCRSFGGLSGPARPYVIAAFANRFGSMAPLARRSAVFSVPVSISLIVRLWPPCAHAPHHCFTRSAMASALGAEPLRRVGWHHLGMRPFGAARCWMKRSGGAGDMT